MDMNTAKLETGGGYPHTFMIEGKPSLLYYWPSEVSTVNQRTVKAQEYELIGEGPEHELIYRKKGVK